MSAQLRFLKLLGESSFWRKVGRLHARLYRMTGGRVGHSAGGLRNLLLTTTGRKSGEPRTVPLTYIDDGDDWIIVASNGGSDRPPAWWRNLEKNPRARVQVGRESFEVTASKADPERRGRLWPTLKEVNPFYGRYEQIANREIPVVVLRRGS